MTEASAATVSSTEAATVGDAVVQAVAEATGTDPAELDPLYGVVDPDALDHLFRSRSTGTDRAEGRVAFTMAGCRVTVHAGGEVVARPTDAPQPGIAEDVDARNPVHE